MQRTKIERLDNYYTKQIFPNYIMTIETERCL